VINETGNVKNLTLISGHMLAPSALQAIKKWKYKPFQVDGKTAAVQAEVEVSVPENITQSDIEKEGNFQEAYGPNERAGREALGKCNLATAEAKLLIARAAAEESRRRRGPSLRLATDAALHWEISLCLRLQWRLAVRKYLAITVERLCATQKSGQTDRIRTRHFALWRFITSSVQL
jgi:hypothetical protein